MKRWYIIFLVPVIVLSLIVIFEKKSSKIDIKDKDYSSSYSKIAINVLKNKANDESITNIEDGHIYEMYAFNHDATYYMSKNTDYRYVGRERVPNNYVYFNCSDITNIETCEIWRIVGVFPVKNEQNKFVDRIKIVRQDSIGQFAYDSNGTTDWGRATLKDYLNNDYYNSLSESAKNMISESMYYLGPIGNNDLVESSEYYSRERSNANVSGEYSEYFRTWTGKISLLYPSDYYYGIGWVSNFSNTILLNREGFLPNGNNNLFIDSREFINYVEPTTLKEVRPTLYLKEDVLITSGYGSITSPYVLMTKDDFQSQKFDYKIGDEVYYNNELYYVLDNSLADSDYVVAFKDVPLTEKYTYENDLDSIAILPFDNNKKCYYKSSIAYDYSGCSNNLNSASIKKILDKWSNDEFNSDDLVEVDGYKVRLITQDEILNGLKFEEKDYISLSDNYKYLQISDLSPNFIKGRRHSCWTMDKYQDSNKIISFGSVTSRNEPTNALCIDPVINFKKSSIGDNNEYHVGDQIKYRDVDYYVIDDSDSSINYVTVIRMEPLVKKQINDYSDNKFNNIGSAMYMNSNINFALTYKNSSVRKIVDSWIDKNFDDDDLKEIDGLKGRLISYDELFENLYYEIRSFQVNSVGREQLVKTSKTPEWAYKYKYWTETPIDDKGISVFIVTNYGSIITSDITSYNAVRPVVYLKKSAIGKISSKYTLDEEEKVINNKEIKCTPKYRKETLNYYNEYNVGDEINYKDDNYFVIRNSDKDTNYVTVLKDELLLSKDFNFDNKYYNKYIIHNFLRGSDYISENIYYDSDECNINNQNECKNSYDTSYVKKIIDNWVKVELDENDLETISGYKARILTLDELMTNFGYEKSSNVYSSSYITTSNIPDWLKKYDYWIDSNIENNKYNYYMTTNGVVNTELVYYPKKIVPIINLKKSVIGDKNEYVIGDEVTYKNNKYYVVENSDSTKKYVVLFKEDPFTQKQINLYLNLDYDSNYSEIFNGPYFAQYYFSDKCSNEINIFECKNDYNSSNIKNIIDNWINSKDIEKDLIEVYGYKARLLNEDDLFNHLNYTNDKYSNYTGITDAFLINADVPSFVYSPNEKYWTMIESNSERYNYSINQNVYNYLVYIILKNGYLASIDVTSQSSDYSYVNNYYAIRPVLNLNKCAIEGGCITEEIEIEDGCLEDNTTSIDVPSTLSIISKVILFISCALIISGCCIFGYNYYKSRQEKK